MVYRTVLAWILVVTLLMVVVVAMLVISSWRSVTRLEPIQDSLAFYSELEQLANDTRQRLLQAAEMPPELAEVAKGAAAGSSRLLERDGALSEHTRGRLARAAEMFGAGSTGDELGQAVELLHQALEGEIRSQQTLLRDLDEENRRELHAALLVGAVVPIGGVVFLLLFRRRVLIPLNDLSYLMGLMARKDYTRALIDNVDPLMRPLFEKYNRMVDRVQAVEHGHIQRESALRRDVDSATKALVKQQMTMARSERMAAVGEMAARMAHELRNPLSGVLMALTNLRRETDSEEHQERLGIVMSELERISRSLTDLVDEARQEPERPRRLCLAEVIGELHKVMGYQLPAEVSLGVDIPGDLYWTLPESELRNAVMNLILNASQALEEGPGSIRVSARAAGDELHIQVCDDGPGFPAELLHFGVQEFRSWRRGGTGLGLATVRRFVRDRGGRLDLTNPEEGGACASLVLPREENHG